MIASQPQQTLRAPHRRIRFRGVATLVATLAFAAPVARAHAQSADEAVAAGIRAADARNATEALADFERALALDAHNYDALWHAAITGVDLGEFEPNADRRKTLFKTAEERARLAVQVKQGDPEGHFALARALGRTALTLGTRDRIKYAKDIRDQALTCLNLNPKHPGCLHVMGGWNAEVMRLNGFSRMIAKNFLGGKVFEQASWREAQRYMVAAVTADPARIVHRLDLARVYRDMDRTADARSQYEAAINGKLIDYNDPHYKEQAAAELKKL